MVIRREGGTDHYDHNYWKIHEELRDILPPTLASRPKRQDGLANRAVTCRIAI